MSEATSLWIDGKSVQGHGDLIDIDDPATGKAIGQLRLANSDDLDTAIASAKKAQAEWANASLATRVSVMFKMRQLILDHQDELADIIVAEGGKTHGDALGEIARGRETIDFACGINAALKGEFTYNASRGVDVHTVRQPVGIVAGIAPFNFPVMVPMWMHPIALATGNAFILKPASPVPTASLFIAELYKEAGLPDGLFNVVPGNRQIVSAICEHPGVDAISFVGSSPVAHIVQNTGVEHGKRVQALGGANNHAIVMPDADVEFAAQHISSGAFGAAGERCMALPVIVTVGGVEDKLIPALKARATKIVTDAGTNPDAEMGPVITRAAQERITSWIDEAEKAGAKVVLDGRGYTPDNPAEKDGFWLAPTILDDVPTNLPIYCEETFGPVLAIVHADTYEEAIELVNSAPFGNGSAIFTSSGEAAREFSLDAQAGMIGINVPIPVPVAYYSFGGWKESLLGDTHIHGPEGVKFYTKGKVITSRWPSQGDHVGHVGMNFPTNA
ncbi:iolA (Myo-inositol catabolism IolA protein) (Methylmalonic acid semialdehyde dehydrogenase) [Propionibacterium freudenreichii subsp. freudenreichii]|jgi:malonate-semialdehyde dehydrogenase (acetylating)/methylmalonate-semialdehyde dehydrogenase|uniref:IolA (Myo-inositol catabolism IolA protein) (Methylmalonic acid semialdehyde dehydrogenase) n=1 Tax=Propionibacterium freudenreichii subsp. freudenreichii TaxID=66712 RepID=A0A0B7P1R3_PROFF|nr:CoA-acylating methylmalonate-semialdehyde dehydrogenase [Propionibacterium freudenreichii]CEG94119.1 iolA (Myo-inositol catabolism IolA protein) (Methylmalonic acid semialdehyde dehydrogenase) [Propionibacterium freudenreichii]CEP27733.1 iolA (Myo-inositol catabolism IolA protein) (Methylmalonic acid semialdehyde dehydrogenase) [Propionibacterium freudenreichii subsp. freudenreichii]